MHKESIPINVQSFTYKYLWVAVRANMDAVEHLPKKAGFLRLAAMTLAFFVLEAYLNHLGELLFPEVWKDEKEKFKGDGTLGKLDFLLEHCHAENLCKGQPPYQSAKELEKLRKLVAHGRTERFTANVEAIPGELPPFVEADLTNRVSADSAKRNISGIEEIIRHLHGAARSRFPDKKLESDPLGPILGFQNT
jgi:hypothetical protein